MAHEGTSGVQQHSCGSIYPWTISAHDGAKLEIVDGRVVLTEGGVIALRNGATGKVAKYFAYNSLGTFNPITKRMEGGDFKEAHAKAERYAQLYKLGERYAQLYKLGARIE